MLAKFQIPQEKSRKKSKKRGAKEGEDREREGTRMKGVRVKEMEVWREKMLPTRRISNWLKIIFNSRFFG